MRRLVTTVLVPLLAAAVMAAGLVAIVASTPQSASFGWFAYAPLSATVFSPTGAIVIGWGSIAGAAAVALGLAALAFWAGFTLATARTRRPPRGPNT
jgi:heme/copper-type cytochrome/quinol oxidase subunit 1